MTRKMTYEGGWLLVRVLSCWCLGGVGGGSSWLCTGMCSHVRLSIVAGGYRSWQVVIDRGRWLSKSGSQRRRARQYAENENENRTKSDRTYAGPLCHP